MILHFNVQVAQILEDLMILMITAKMENFLNKVEEPVVIMVVVAVAEIVVIVEIVVMVN